MNKRKQMRFVHGLCRCIAHDMCMRIKAGHVPNSWDGIEIRAWFAENAENAIMGDEMRHDSPRRRAFRNTLRINCL